MRERIVERRDTLPVRFRRRTRSRVTRGDCGLQRIRAERTGLPGTFERCQATTDEQLIPEAAVLIEEQDWLARRTDTRVRARGLNLHQCDEAMNLRFVGDELGYDPTEAERILAERGPHPIVAGGRRISLVEHEAQKVVTDVIGARSAAQAGQGILRVVRRPRLPGVLVHLMICPTAPRAAGHGRN